MKKRNRLIAIIAAVVVIGGGIAAGLLLRQPTVQTTAQVPHVVLLKHPQNPYQAVKDQSVQLFNELAKLPPAPTQDEAAKEAFKIIRPYASQDYANQLEANNYQPLAGIAQPIDLKSSGQYRIIIAPVDASQVSVQQPSSLGLQLAGLSIDPTKSYVAQIQADQTDQALRGPGVGLIWSTQQDGTIRVVFIGQ